MPIFASCRIFSIPAFASISLTASNSLKKNVLLKNMHLKIHFNKKTALHVTCFPNKTWKNSLLILIPNAFSFFRSCTRLHKCPKLCHEPCGDCMHQLPKKLTCGHHEKCFMKERLNYSCIERVNKKFRCGHEEISECAGITIFSGCSNCRLRFTRDPDLSLMLNRRLRNMTIRDNDDDDSSDCSFTQSDDDSDLFDDLDY